MRKQAVQVIVVTLLSSFGVVIRKYSTNRGAARV
jgi:hypothetical protein